MALRGIMRTMTASPARELGPRMPQRKYIERPIWRGQVQMRLTYSESSMNFCESMDMRFVVSPIVISFLPTLESLTDFLYTAAVRAVLT